MVMSWVIHIGITISVIQLVGAYMMSSMYMFIVISVAFIEQACGAHPLSAITSSVTVCVP
jgi:hypothetical protein